MNVTQPTPVTASKRKRLTLLTLSGFIGIILLFLFGSTLLSPLSPVEAAPGVNEADLDVTISISDEPLLGGSIGYSIRVQNAAPLIDDLEDDKAYNVTLVETLPAGIAFQSASPTPESVVVNPDGTTTLVWNNFTDLEAEEDTSFSILGLIDPALTLTETIVSSALVRANTVPDNSGVWITATTAATATLQAIDIEKAILQSTGVNQATGSSGWESTAPGSGGGPQWPYQYQLTVRNNNVGNTDDVIVTDTLPSGVAYLGPTTITPNPNGVTTVPTMTVLGDGSLQLVWNLGTLTPAEYTTPPVIDFTVAIPYRERVAVAGDGSCTNGNVRVPNDGAPTDPGCFDGPIIPDPSVWYNSYDAEGSYLGETTRDGVTYTPQDDAVVPVTAKYQTVEKSVNNASVEYLDTVTYTINYYISEYYTLTGSVITDVIPDGLSYITGTASPAPISVQEDTPGTGQTTIVWSIPDAETEPGDQGTLTFSALVDFDYETTNDPVVAFDGLVNQVTIDGDWTDDVDPSRTGTTQDSDTATINTSGPSIDKQVFVPETGLYSDESITVTIGDTLTFRLNYDAPSGVDAKDNYLIDFLPRGMSLVAQRSCVASGTITNTFVLTGTAAAEDNDPCTFYTDTLGGLDFVRWNYGFTDVSFEMTSTIEVQIDDIPSVSSGIILANFLKQSGTNTDGETYSLRDLVNITVAEPNIVLTKTATPQTNLVAGDTVTYTIDLENTGVYTAFNVVITDTIPTFIAVDLPSCSSSPVATNCSVHSGSPELGSGGVITWTKVPTIPVGGTQQYVYTTTVAPGIPASSDIINLASATFNTQPDGGGRDFPPTDDPNDDNTDDEIVSTAPITVDKRIIDTSHPSTSGFDVTIGEGITYQVSIVIPDGISNTVIVTDVLDSGLAFVSANVTSSPDLTINGSTTAAFSETPSGSAVPADQGREMVFDFGIVTNANVNPAETESITITYVATVLDITTTVSSGILDNVITLDTQNAIVTDTERVDVVEPELTIDKT
ncbi:MAG: hypothetical protein AAF633_11425, partial [Chloroflexota bacterium]